MTMECPSRHLGKGAISQEYWPRNLRFVDLQLHFLLILKSEHPFMIIELFMATLSTKKEKLQHCYEIEILY